MLKRPVIFLVVLLASFWCPAKTPAADDATRPNVLFIAVDDLNDWVGFLAGHPQIKTPNMDRVAKRGVVFANAHCAAPLCCPSRAAVFSGKQPFHTGVYTNSENLRRLHPELVLMPQHFKNHGYRAFGTGKLLHRRRPDLFDEHFFTEQRWSPFSRSEVKYTAAALPSKGRRPRHVIGESPDHPRVVLPLNRMPSDRSPKDPKGESFDWGPVDVADRAMGDAKVADWAVERLGREHKEPFFLAVGFYRPHIPLYAPRKYYENYPFATTELPEVLDADLEDLSETGKRRALEAVTAGLHETVVRHSQWKAAVASYLACVSFVDAQIGKLLDTLDRGPHADTTIVVLWSDHGWHLGEKQHWGKWTGWERSTRVPLVVAPARSGREKFKTGSVCRQPVSLIDLYPTLIDMCRLKPRPELDGLSLVPQLVDPEAVTDRAVVTTFGKGNYAVRTRRWRLIRYADGSEELYDHSSDPLEWINLDRETRYAELRAGLRRWLPGRAVGQPR